MFGGDVVCVWKVLLWPADILSLVACSGNSSQVSHPPIYTCCTKEGNKTTLFPCQSKVFSSSSLSFSHFLSLIPSLYICWSCNFVLKLVGGHFALQIFSPDYCFKMC